MKLFRVHLVEAARGKVHRSHQFVVVALWATDAVRMAQEKNSGIDFIGGIAEDLLDQVVVPAGWQPMNVEEFERKRREHSWIALGQTQR